MFLPKNNLYDFRGITSYNRILEPTFANVIKPKPSLTSKLLSSKSFKSIDSLINGAQKMIRVYDQAMPIISQSKPMLDNIRTTFKVAKAFKRFSGESSLEKAFDHLPDAAPPTKKEEVNDPVIKKEDAILQKNIKIDNSIPAPFYPML